MPTVPAFLNPHTDVHVGYVFSPRPRPPFLAIMCRYRFGTAEWRQADVFAAVEAARRGLSRYEILQA